MNPRHNKTQNSSFTVSKSAAEQIARVLEHESGEKMFRVAVNGGGCSGFQYEFTLDDKIKANDIIIKQDGARVLVDDLSLGFLENAQLDWVDELIGSSFKIKNPNAKSSCGCGMSFSV